MLGELLAGVVLGNIAVPMLDGLKADAAIDTLSRLGVILLLFQVGLESTIGQMMRVGLSSLLVATLGVIGPFALGWGVGAWLLPDASCLCSRVPWRNAVGDKRRHHRACAQGSRADR